MIRRRWLKIGYWKKWVKMRTVIWSQISDISLKKFSCHKTVFPLRICFDAFHQKLYCLSWPWIRYNWTVLSSRNAWYFLNIKLDSFRKESHAFILEKNYKNMHNFVNRNSVVLEAFLLRVCCMYRHRKYNKIFCKNVIFVKQNKDNCCELFLLIYMYLLSYPIVIRKQIARKMIPLKCF